MFKSKKIYIYQPIKSNIQLYNVKGALDIVKLMFTMQPQEKKICLSCTDAQKMTPLHCAAMFDHPDIVEYLIGEGADINALDREHRSPLLLAASRAAWKTVLALIRFGAQITIKDANARNVLHLVIMNGGRLEEFARAVSLIQCNAQLQQLLNEKDSSGCSALHYASREGNFAVTAHCLRYIFVSDIFGENISRKKREIYLFFSFKTRSYPIAGEFNSLGCMHKFKKQ